MRMKRLVTTYRLRDHGCIVTAAHNDGPPLLTFHSPGRPKAAIESACARLDELGPGWRIVSISTPASIYRDLHGTRERLDRNEHSGGAVSADDPRSTERTMLQSIGRLDLLKPLPFIARNNPLAFLPPT